MQKLHNNPPYKWWKYDEDWLVGLDFVQNLKIIDSKWTNFGKLTKEEIIGLTLGEGI